MGTINYLDEPIEGLVIEYLYRDHKGKLTINRVVREASDMTRVYFTDEMEGEDAHNDAMYVDSAWNIFLERIIKVTKVYSIYQNPEWEI